MTAEATPIVYRVAPIASPNITESAELLTEQLETIPYDPPGYPVASDGSNWPPAGFKLAVDSVTTSSNTASLLPGAYNLEWVQGDTAELQFLFTDVFWTLTDPGEDNAEYTNIPKSVSNKVLTSNIVTLTTSSPHGYQVGYSVVVTNVGSPFDGTHIITSVPSSTTFSYSKTNADITSAAASGSVEIANMPEWVATEWAAQVRNPYIYSTYAADYWVPAYGYQYNWWRGNSIVAEFEVTAEATTIPDVTPTQWATHVTMLLPSSNSANILPGNWYRWDLQTRTIEEVVKTHLRGKARVVTEWTVR